MRAKLLIASLVLALGSASSALGADVRSADRQDSYPLDERSAPGANYCVGGAEGRKLIPHGGDVRNPFRQTTPLDCESAGGQPTVMPDLIPSITDGILA